MCGLFGDLPRLASRSCSTGSPWAFGHDGAGGSIGFADRARDLPYGYTTLNFPNPAGAHQHGLNLAKQWAGMRRPRPPTRTQPPAYFS